MNRSSTVGGSGPRRELSGSPRSWCAAAALVVLTASVCGASVIEFCDPAVFDGAEPEDYGEFWSNWNLMNSRVRRTVDYLETLRERQRRWVEVQRVRAVEAEARRSAAERTRSESRPMFWPFAPRDAAERMFTTGPVCHRNNQSSQAWHDAALLLCAAPPTLARETILELTRRPSIGPAAIDLHLLRLDLAGVEARRGRESDVLWDLRRERSARSVGTGDVVHAPRRPSGRAGSPVVRRAPAPARNPAPPPGAVEFPWAGMRVESTWLREAAAAQPWAGMAAESRTIAGR